MAKPYEKLGDGLPGMAALLDAVYTFKQFSQADITRGEVPLKTIHELDSVCAAAQVIDYR
ncbi:MAG: hypothetical protein HY372_03550 [Candidatus Andersenbacteria bacterium]|nr:hypothetical protein [Candidatus Andersenbacteria bacterium]